MCLLAPVSPSNESNVHKNFSHWQAPYDFSSPFETLNLVSNNKGSILLGGPLQKMTDSRVSGIDKFRYMSPPPKGNMSQKMMS